jgi:hypothetical protein
MQGLLPICHQTSANKISPIRPKASNSRKGNNLKRSNTMVLRLGGLYARLENSSVYATIFYKTMN